MKHWPECPVCKGSGIFPLTRDGEVRPCDLGPEEVRRNEAANRRAAEARRKLIPKWKGKGD